MTWLDYGVDEVCRSIDVLACYRKLSFGWYSRISFLNHVARLWQGTSTTLEVRRLEPRHVRLRCLYVEECINLVVGGMWK